MRSQDSDLYHPGRRRGSGERMGGEIGADAALASSFGTRTHWQHATIS